MKKNTKIVILATLVFLSSILAWYALSTVINLGPGRNSLSLVQILLPLVYPIITFCFFLALASVTVVLVSKEWILIPVWFLSGLSLFLFFSFSPWLFVITLLLTVAFLYYSLRVKSEVKTHITFSLAKSLHWGLSLVVLAVIISITLIFYITTTQKQRETNQEAIDSLVAEATNFANQIIPSRLEGYDPNMTLDEFVFLVSAGAAEEIGGRLNKEIQTAFGNPLEANNQVLVERLRAMLLQGEITKSQLPKEIRDKLDSGNLTNEELVSSQVIQGIFQEEINRARDEVLKNIGIEAQGDDLMSEVIAKIIRLYAFQFLGPYEKFLTPLLALSLFFVLSFFNFFYKAIIKFLALLIYRFLLALKFVNIKHEKRDIQVVTLE